MADDKKPALIPGLSTITGMVAAAQGMNDTSSVHIALALRQLAKLDKAHKDCMEDDGSTDPEKLRLYMDALSKEAKIERQVAEHLERAMALKGVEGVADSRFAKAIEEHDSE